MNIGFEAKRVFHNKTGLGNYSRDLVRMIATKFPETSLFLYNPKKAKKSIFTYYNKNIVERNPKTKFKNYWRQKGVVKDLLKDKIEIFHGLSGEIPSGLKKNNIKSVVTIHDLIFMRYPNLYSFFDRKIHFYKFKKAAQNADMVIAISEQTKKDIIQYLKIDANKIQVVYQGCQPVFKTKIPEDQLETVKKKYLLPDQFVLNVGTIEARKNALTIVKAIQNIDTTLVLIGKETEYAKEIHEHITSHSLQHKVRFLKGIDSFELATIYQLATVFIYPSLFEGFGIPIIEALYSKIPVITTNSGVFPEAAGPNSIYINPTNANELATKIQFLLENPEKRKEIAEKGWHFVQQFNDDVIANRLMEIYTSLLA
ncbi:Glycosyltransferase involved in cell wall bisynthesis [Flavobacterium sp. 9AF]|uniref:glycosyltransferase family 4 protein n=1 Tax=Flavobacterium sp. 9AF TaxID=2653142 RepID=UPI0012F14774|nr:glycosyltransferase family 1 protein [Flavobacterium sp. 9AF]VXC12579.1 Glycosyltransferase involved in cell wall bisynthesis [Flavobacterium sp. 9AF]